MKTKITYKCQCIAEEVSLDVQGRGRSEEITDWLDRIVKPALGRDHASRSPLCRSPAVEYLKLPIPEDNRRIGDGEAGMAVMIAAADGKLYAARANAGEWVCNSVERIRKGFLVRIEDGEAREDDA